WRRRHGGCIQQARNWKTLYQNSDIQNRQLNAQLLIIQNNPIQTTMAGYPPPRFAGRAEDDLDNYIKDYRLYLTAAGIATNNAAGKQRALSLWQSCLIGDAANWRETKIAGKKFRLNHVRCGNNLADMATVRALNNVNMTAAMIAASDGTPAPALPAGATGNTVIPAHNVHVNEDWSIAGGCAVDAGTATNAPNNATNNNNHIVLPDINISQEIYLFKTQYTTILRQQQEMIFGTLVQGSDSIREYYRKICRYTKLGGVNDAHKRAQFLRGLSRENKLEIKRLGLNKPLNDELIESLEAIETEKNEMLLSDISTPVQAKAPSITTADIERIVSARVADVLQKSQPLYVPPVSHPTPVIDPRYKEAFDRLVILALALGYPIQDDVKWEKNVTINELEEWITNQLLTRLSRDDPAHDNMYI